MATNAPVPDQNDPRAQLFQTVTDAVTLSNAASQNNPANPFEMMNRAIEQNRAAEMQARLTAAANAGDPTATVQTELVERQSNNNVQSNVADYYESMNNNASIGSVAEALRGDPELANVSADYLARQIQNVMQQAPGQINPTQAGAIIRQSIVRQENPTLSRIGNWLSNNLVGGGAAMVARGLFGGSSNEEVRLGQGRVLSQEQIRNRTGAIRNGDTQRDFEESRRLGLVNQRLTQARQLADTTARDLQTVRRRAEQGNPGAVRLLPEMERRAAEANAMLNMVQSAIGGDSRNTVARSG